ncbi:hypothetical protein QCA50_009187 [Cerrena zonata]|uniref:DUF6535 domain-containing protein n=1 Tax=Cerrena zonata TaxID=2478898 RepID=A0AAW0G2M4_9APHY
MYNFTNFTGTQDESPSGSVMIQMPEIQPITANRAPDREYDQTHSHQHREEFTSPPRTEEVSRVQIDSEHTGWARLSDLYHKYDKTRIQDVKEDVDTLLVFTGLFSAVLSAFVIESYTTLQQQPQDLTNQILLQILSQLHTLSVRGNPSDFIPPSHFSVEPSFVVSHSSVRINTLWSLSLILTLITASLGILVKQWLHEFMAQEPLEPKKRLKIRLLREEGVQTWGVFELAACLPLLLQTTLFLFFIGLSEFLRNLNAIVGWATTGMMFAWLGFFIFATFAPIFSSRCPYKTPILTHIFSTLRVKLTRQAIRGLNRLPVSWRARPTSPGFTPRFLRVVTGSVIKWFHHSKFFEEKAVGEEKTLDMAVLSHSLHVLQGEQLQDTLVQCLRSCELPYIDQYIRFLMEGTKDRPQFCWLPRLSRERRGLCLEFISACSVMMGTIIFSSSRRLTCQDYTKVSHSHLSICFLSFGNSATSEEGILEASPTSREHCNNSVAFTLSCRIQDDQLRRQT